MLQIRVILQLYYLYENTIKFNCLASMSPIGHDTTILIGGDFNIIRGPHEKNNANYSDRWPFLFNAIIDAFNLRELELSGRQFTWANNLQVPTFEKTR